MISFFIFAKPFFWRMSTRVNSWMMLFLLIKLERLWLTCYLPLCRHIILISFPNCACVMLNKQLWCFWFIVFQENSSYLKTIINKGNKQSHTRNTRNMEWSPKIRMNKTFGSIRRKSTLVILRKMTDITLIIPNSWFNGCGKLNLGYMNVVIWWSKLLDSRKWQELEVVKWVLVVML